MSNIFLWSSNTQLSHYYIIMNEERKGNITLEVVHKVGQKVSELFFGLKRKKHQKYYEVFTIASREKKLSQWNPSHLQHAQENSKHSTSYDALCCWRVIQIVFNITSNTVPMEQFFHYGAMSSFLQSQNAINLYQKKHLPLHSTSKEFVSISWMWKNLYF